MHLEIAIEKLIGAIEELTKTIEHKDAVVPKEQENLDRAAIKNELDSLGVKYGARQGTQYLASLLKKSKAKSPKTKLAKVEQLGGREPTEPIATDTPLPVEEVKVVEVEPIAEPVLDDNLSANVELEVSEEDAMQGATLEDARTFLIAYATDHGDAKARELLSSFGAQKLSDLSAHQRAEFINKVVN